MWIIVYRGSRGADFHLLNTQDQAIDEAKHRSKEDACPVYIAEVKAIAEIKVELNENPE